MIRSGVDTLAASTPSASAKAHATNPGAPSGFGRVYADQEGESAQIASEPAIVGSENPEGGQMGKASATPGAADGAPEGHADAAPVGEELEVNAEELGAQPEEDLLLLKDLSPAGDQLGGSSSDVFTDLQDDALQNIDDHTIVSGDLNSPGSRDLGIEGTGAGWATPGSDPLNKAVEQARTDPHVSQSSAKVSPTDAHGLTAASAIDSDIASQASADARIDGHRGAIQAAPGVGAAQIVGVSKDPGLKRAASVPSQAAAYLFAQSQISGPGKLRPEAQAFSGAASVSEVQSIGAGKAEGARIGIADPIAAHSQVSDPALFNPAASTGRRVEVYSAALPSSPSGVLGLASEGLASDATLLTPASLLRDEVSGDPRNLFVTSETSIRAASLGPDLIAPKPASSGCDGVCLPDRRDDRLAQDERRRCRSTNVIA